MARYCIKTVSKDRVTKMFWVRTELRRVRRYSHSFSQQYWLSVHTGALTQIDGQHRTQWSEHLPSPCLLLLLSHAHSKDWGGGGGSVNDKKKKKMVSRSCLEGIVLQQMSLSSGCQNLSIPFSMFLGSQVYGSYCRCSNRKQSLTLHILTSLNLFSGINQLQI